MGGGGEQTTTTTSNPPAYAAPYLKDILKESQGLYRANGPEYYPGSTVIPMAGETQAALDAQTQRALQGSPVAGAAQGLAQQTLEGNFLSGGNPYFQGAFDAMSRPVTDAVQAAMAKSGRLGSGANTQVLSRELGDIGSKLMYQNYSDERNRQMQMAGLAPQLAQIDYDDIARLAQVGGAYEAQGGAELQDDVNRFNWYQQQPWDKLAQYSNFVQGGTYGGQQTQTTPVQSNVAGGVLGGAMSGAGTGAMFGPWGAAIGGVAGGLLGGLGNSGCWVARAVYGPGEDFLRFRRWMLFKSPKWLLRLYWRHGERWAETVRRRPALRRALRPIMNFVARGA